MSIVNSATTVNGTTILELQTTGVTAATINGSQVLSTVKDALVNGVTVGLGSGAVATNVALGGLWPSFADATLSANTTGAQNTAIGVSALASNQTGDQNVAVGSAALLLNVSGGQNTAVGYASLQKSTTSNNTGFGSGTLNSLTSGNLCTAVGSSSGFYNQTGIGNVSLGYQSLFGAAGQSNSYNTAIGTQALGSTTTASNNTAVGYQAGYSITTTANNTMLGYQAGYSATTNGPNTFVGYQAGYSQTGNGLNAYFGYGCGSQMTTGGNNTLIGGFSGNSGGLDIRTASNYIVLSDGAGNPRGFFDNNGNFLVGGAIGASGGLGMLPGGSGGSFALYSNNNTPGGSASILANTNSGGTDYAVTIYKAGSQVGSISMDNSSTQFNTSSDYRLKENVTPLQNSGVFIDSLQPKTWSWIRDGEKGVGFIAHEVQEISPSSVVGTKDAVDENGDPVYQAMEYGSAEFVANIVAELQSLRKRVAILEAK